ncbi:MAG: toll/interleukin-1 receptor domain-containing protein [Anaerolineae bacterium]|nr:toll/interleukin-1 receptor domain-containing protein [Anaerolineae bacterium]
MTLDEFLDRVTQRPLPNSRIAQVRTLAKELAEGAAEGLWGTSFVTRRDDNQESGIGSAFHPENEAMARYVAQRWQNKAASSLPSLTLLSTNDYLKVENFDRFRTIFTITRAAFDLIDEVEPAKIFISYKRSESSAFALLVLARLKAEGLEPFLDLAIEPGEQWQQHLEQRIRSSDYFILLLGPTTLHSTVTLQEIAWALQHDCTLIPIWHNGFRYQPGAWTLTAAVNAALQNTHTIRVLEESALAYNNAIVELLNRFGITP